MPFTVEPLPYPFDALEPHIDAKTMELHHDKHHGAYVAKLNAALEHSSKLQGKTIEELLVSLRDIPEDVRGVVRNHGGGHHNHSLFWKLLSPKGGGDPPHALAKAISRDFGSIEAFKEGFTNAALGLFGSGWQWLAKDGSGKLSLVSLPNQDSLLSIGLYPVIGLDLWEHAYYLKHQNRRADYIASFWNVISWEEAERLYST